MNTPNFPNDPHLDFAPSEQPKPAEITLPMNKNYAVIRSETLLVLEHNVIQGLKEGWACTGGIAVLRMIDPHSTSGEIIYFYQAMIKIEILINQPVA